ncbi:TrbG/VirB9 family P-type conjugative transfer protein [Pseudorhodobacter sp.]|uniref:TrbG/VirB9 family P-type conjugative transfer protein n=1 Tax=Pseudorhodobacter sp. TaxID=1934400 RepID=UPI0026476F0E|nr:TrbG/VirB9 family P-type conjugative transfer protein [Pseudorhodobacter sp.]MDN5788999.1 TrbG/VirB9 family P-type conjugative transfer protein [Pseudorhodobacter sp.]
MMKSTALALLLALSLTPGLSLGLTGQALAAGVPKAGHRDSRIRNAVYDPDQVYVIETDLRFATTIHFGRGERFEAVIAGDTESFDITPITDLGNVVSIKLHVSKAVTNMTVITNRHSYSFELREGHVRGANGKFFEVRFSYPSEGKSRATGLAKGYISPKNYSYKISGKAKFQPSTVYDDGRYTYFQFAEGVEQPAIFKADETGRERTVNWTQKGSVVRVLGVNPYWTLRIGTRALCITRDNTSLSVGN